MRAISEAGDLSSRVRAICEKGGREIPEELQPIVDSYYWARQEYSRNTLQGLDAMARVCDVLEKLPEDAMEELTPLIVLVREKTPIPPGDPKRANAAVALPGEMRFGHLNE